MGRGGTAAVGAGWLVGGIVGVLVDERWVAGWLVGDWRGACPRQAEMGGEIFPNKNSGKSFLALATTVTTVKKAVATLHAVPLKQSSQAPGKKAYSNPGTHQRKQCHAS